MATSLDNRVELKNEFYRITGTSSSDTALGEIETVAADELNHLIFQGMREAQSWYIDTAGGGILWEKVATAITSWSGDDATDGGRYKALETDFGRLDGDRENSALRTVDGERWGRQIDHETRYLRGDNFYLKGSNLWITRGAVPPASLVYDYIHEIAELTDDSTAPDFPERDRRLICLEAANIFIKRPACPLDAEGKQEIRADLKETRRAIYTRARRTREPRRMRSSGAIGNRFFGTGR